MSIIAQSPDIFRLADRIFPRFLFSRLLSAGGGALSRRRRHLRRARRDPLSARRVAQEVAGFTLDCAFCRARLLNLAAKFDAAGVD